MAAQKMATDVETGHITGTADKDYNLIWFVEQCLSNALRLQTYIQDAERAGDTELAEFFRRAQGESRKGADQGKQKLKERLALTWTTDSDVTTVLTDDHREVERAFQELESRQGSPQHRRDLADYVIAELVRHSVAEEQYLYPAARKSFPDGDTVADQEIAEHAEAERTMKDLDGLDPTDPRFDELLGKLMTEIRHHVADEESQLFPRLRQACSEAELVELGEKIVRAKEMAPTRPHPAAPDKPPMNKILAPGAGLVDRMRDALTGRAT